VRQQLTPDFDRARRVASLIYDAFNDPNRGIFGHTTMPEDILPQGVDRGSYEHRLFITLTVSIDYMRDAEALWAASRRAYEDDETRYLFFPQEVARAGSAAVVRDLQRHRLAQRPRQDAHIWHTVSLTLLRKWQGDPLALVQGARYDASTLLNLAREEPGFPFLRGPKISALWVRMLRDNVGLGLRNMDKIPIPTDIHIVRATFCTGVLRGKFSGTMSEARPYVEEAWAAALPGTGLIPVDIDEPLWHLSRYGCSARTPSGCPLKEQCPVGAYCARGAISVSTKGVEVRT
jgi:hypothetical protein